MRCHYLSDLHLERQDFTAPLPKGDVPIIAGDLCEVRCLEPQRADRYSVEQRDRVRRFIERAQASHIHVLLVAGNHEHYGSVLEDTAAILARALPGVTVLDDSAVDIGGVRFFGATLWTDFEGRKAAVLDGVRRRMGEYFFVRTRTGSAAGESRKLKPEDTLAAHDRALAALQASVRDARGRPTVVVTHHAPSRLGLNAAHSGNGLDGAYASDLDQTLAALDNVVAWVHGHTHVARSYRIGAVTVRSNALGFIANGHTANERSARGFKAGAGFDVR